MIYIKIESEMVDATRKFKSDAQSVRFLKHIAKLHAMERLRRAGQKPKKDNYRRWEMRKFRNDVKSWELSLKEHAIPCKVVIEHI